MLVTTIAGDVLAYTLEGGKPLWTAQVQGPLTGQALHLKGIQLNGSSAGALPGFDNVRRYEPTNESQSLRGPADRSLHTVKYPRRRHDDRSPGAQPT